MKQKHIQTLDSAGYKKRNKLVCWQVCVGVSVGVGITSSICGHTQYDDDYHTDHAHYNGGDIPASGVAGTTISCSCVTSSPGRIHLHTQSSQS